jgi:hypothetical protein
VADRYTITRAVKNLVDQGKLQRVVVVFNDQKGRAVTKPMLLRPGVAISSQAAKNAIKKIEELHPLPYIPLDMPPEAAPKKPISRYNRKDDTIAFMTTPVNQPEEDIPPWEAYFQSRKKMLAKRRNEKFQSRKQRRLTEESAQPPPFMDAEGQDSAMQDASLQDESLQDALLQDASFQDIPTPDSSHDIAAPGAEFVNDTSL